MTYWGTVIVRKNAREVYKRLRAKFDAGIPMQLDYDELEEYCAKNKAKKRRECTRKQYLAAMRNLKNNAKTTTEL